MENIHALIRWLNLSDYESEIATNSDQVISRLARGNTILQNGERAYVDESTLDDLSKAGDRALGKIDKLVPQLG